MKFLIMELIITSFLVGKFLLCFSLSKNIDRLKSMTKEDESLKCIQGLRVLAMIGVVFGHSLLVCTNAAVYNTRFFEEVI